MSKNSPCEVRGTLSHFKKYRWKDLNKRTLNGLQAKRLQKKNNSSYLKKGILLCITKEEFYNFCDRNQQLILDLYANGETPSIDRIDSTKHYSLDNIQILSLKENIRKVIKS